VESCFPCFYEHFLFLALISIKKPLRLEGQIPISTSFLRRKQYLPIWRSPKWHFLAVPGIVPHQPIPVNIVQKWKANRIKKKKLMRGYGFFPLFPPSKMIHGIMA
jgi:hypothetical protein